MMKNLLKILFIFIISFCFNNKVIACDLFNISPGSEISKLENIVGEIDLDYDTYDEYDVFRLIVSNDLYCPNSSLKRTSSSIFISNNRVTGIEIESYLKNKTYSRVKGNQVFTFINNNYGSIDKEVTEKDWTGMKKIISGNKIILYSKSEKKRGILESALITSKKYYEQTYDEEIIELNE